MVTHPSTNWAYSCLTSVIRPWAVAPCQQTALISQLLNGGCELSYHILPPLIHITAMLYEKITWSSNKRHLSSKWNSSSNYKQYPQGMTDKLLKSNIWVLVNCSANMCQSDTGWFITPKQQGQNLQSLELLYLHFTGGLEDAWKNSPMVRGKE